MRYKNREAAKMPEKACSDKPIIVFMDSLGTAEVHEMMQYLREYLELEYIEKRIDPENKKYFFDTQYKWEPFD